MSQRTRDILVGPEVLNQVVAVVLGGGRGSRLHPLTALRAKPAVPLLGRYRLVDIPLSQCIHSGIRRIYVLTQFNSASLNRHVNNSYRFDTFSKGFVEILAAEQTLESGDWFQGTADAIRQQLRQLKSRKPGLYVILSGDQLYRMDYRDMIHTHLRTGADITVAALPVTAEAARGFGIMRVSPAGRIRQFVEKPDTKEQLAKLVTPPKMMANSGVDVGPDRPYLASMGLYVFRAEVLEQIVTERPDWIDFGKHVIPHSLRDRKVYAHLFNGFWEDIGTVRSYYDVHMRTVAPEPPFGLYDADHIIYTRARYLPGSQIDEARITRSMICEGSRISRAEIRESIVGIRSVIQAGAKVDRSIVMGADYFEGDNTGHDPIPVGIGAKSVISRAIVDKNARIGRNVIIRGSARLRDADGDGYAVRDGIVIVMKNARIPDGTMIGA